MELVIFLIDNTSVLLVHTLDPSELPLTPICKTSQMNDQLPTSLTYALHHVPEWKQLIWPCIMFLLSFYCFVFPMACLVRKKERILKQTFLYS